MSAQPQQQPAGDAGNVADTLLRAMLMQAAASAQTQAPAAAHPAPAPEAAPTRARRGVRPVARLEGWGERIGAIAALGVAAAGWLAGGWSTLTAGAAVGLPIVPAWPWALAGSAPALLAMWLLPLLFSAIELGVDRRGALWPLWWLAVVCDAGSTYYGAVLTIGGRAVQVGPGFVVPSAGPWLWGAATGAAFLLTFGPEFLARRVIRAWV